MASFFNLPIYCLFYLKIPPSLLQHQILYPPLTTAQGDLYLILFLKDYVFLENYLGGGECMLEDHV